VKRVRLLYCALLFTLLAAAPLVAQSAFSRAPGWYKSGLFVGTLAQYRLHEKEYSVGYDGSFFTVVKSGNRVDLPTLGSMAGFGAVLGYSYCEGPREPAILNSIRWTMSKGAGDSAVGSLEYVDHEIGLVMEFLFPFNGGWAVTGQLGWDFQFFSISNGYLPSGGARTDLLISSFLGMEGGVGLAYVIDRRYIIEGRAVIRGFGDNIASGGGVSDSLGGETGRFEYSFELSVGLQI